MNSKLLQLLSKLNWRAMMQIAVSLCLVAATLTVILSTGYDPGVTHWAFATLGTILGFWLKR